MLGLFYLFILIKPVVAKKLVQYKIATAMMPSSLDQLGEDGDKVTE